MKLQNCCETCGFPVDMPRNPVFIKDDVFSIIHYENEVCKECGHLKDGSTIPVVSDLIQEIIVEQKKTNVKDLLKFIDKISPKNASADLMLFYAKLRDKLEKENN